MLRAVYFRRIRLMARPVQTGGATSSNSSSEPAHGDHEPWSTDKAFKLVPQYSYEEVETMTENCKHEIGCGAYGIVYKGRGMVVRKEILALCFTGALSELPDASYVEMDVAVKLLKLPSRSDPRTKDEQDRQAREAFTNEVKVMGWARHQNVVSLLGYCDDTARGHRILISEFVEGGSLADALHRKYDSGASGLLETWESRLDVALAAALGLEYLHKVPIIHADIKSDNILLTPSSCGSLNAKLADFGLAKLFLKDPLATHITIAPIGTPAYCCPQFMRTGHLSTAVDIYSLGVVLMELLTGRRPLQKGKATHISEATQDVNQHPHKVQSFADPVFQNRFNTGAFYVVMGIAEECMRDDRRLRPDIMRVVKELRRAKDLSSNSIPKSLQQGEDYRLGESYIGWLDPATGGLCQQVTIRRGKVDKTMFEWVSEPGSRFQLSAQLKKVLQFQVSCRIVCGPVQPGKYTLSWRLRFGKNFKGSGWDSGPVVFKTCNAELGMTPEGHGTLYSTRLRYLEPDLDKPSHEQPQLQENLAPARPDGPGWIEIQVAEFDVGPTGQHTVDYWCQMEHHSPLRKKGLIIDGLVLRHVRPAEPNVHQADHLTERKTRPSFLKTERIRSTLRKKFVLALAVVRFERAAGLLTEQLHSQTEEQGVEADAVVGNRLVNMFAKCGTCEMLRACLTDFFTKTW